MVVPFLLKGTCPLNGWKQGGPEGKWAKLQFMLHNEAECRHSGTHSCLRRGGHHSPRLEDTWRLGSTENPTRR